MISKPLTFLSETIIDIAVSLLASLVVRGANKNAFPKKNDEKAPIRLVCVGRGPTLGLVTHRFKILFVSLAMHHRERMTKNLAEYFRNIFEVINITGKRCCIIGLLTIPCNVLRKKDIFEEHICSEQGNRKPRVNRTM